MWLNSSKFHSVFAEANRAPAWLLMNEYIVYAQGVPMDAPGVPAHAPKSTHRAVQRHVRSSRGAPDRIQIEAVALVVLVRRYHHAQGFPEYLIDFELK